VLDRLKDVKNLEDRARTQRKKGDALHDVGREEPALSAYREGLAALTDALALIRPDEEALQTASIPLSDDQKDIVNELVELHGARGGMLQRLGLLDEALASYTTGAALEERFAFSTIYNRLNMVKYSLLTGKQQLHELEPQIQALAALIEANLRADRGTSDSGWSWADLGDCLTLLGRPTEARRAYASFVSKAEIRSPERTLDVLQAIASRLEDLSDPDAPRLKQAVKTIQDELIPR
jgi:tetratricopeptide (TPR) repeat protein